MLSGLLSPRKWKQKCYNKIDFHTRKLLSHHWKSDKLPGKPINILSISPVKEVFYKTDILKTHNLRLILYERLKSFFFTISFRSMQGLRSKIKPLFRFYLLRTQKREKWKRNNLTFFLRQLTWNHIVLWCNIGTLKSLETFAVVCTEQKACQRIKSRVWSRNKPSNVPVNKKATRYLPPCDVIQW